MSLGDIRVGQVLYFHFTTRQFSTGAPIASASLALSVYKDDSTTQSTAGVTTTFTGGFDSVAGLVSVKIDTSADGTFYAAGHDFSVVVTAGTADSVSIVGEVVGYFSIENRSALMPTTAARKLDVSAGGEAGLDWANVGSPTTAVDLTNTTIKTTQKVDVDTIKTNPVVNGGTITFPTNATVASTTNISSGTIATVSGNVNGNVAGSVGSVTGAVGSVAGNVGGNVVGSVASVAAAVAITSNIKQNQALAKFEFLMTDSTNHNPSTGLTVTCTRSIDGGAFGAGTLANVTEIANGIYSVDFGAGDLNGKVIVLQATAPASDSTFERIVTQV